VICGLQYTPHPERIRIVWGLPTMMYQGADLELAYSALKESTADLTALGVNIDNPGNRKNKQIDNTINTGSSSSGNVNNAPGTGSQISHKMAMRFAKSDRKFTGDLDQ
jgi:hypothetical protein